MLERVNVKAFRFFCPYIADIFVRGKTLECFEPAGEVVGHQEAVHVGFQLIVGGIVIPLYGGFLESSVHAFHLSVRPWMFWFCESVFDVVLVAAKIKHMCDVLRCRSITVTWRMAELAAIVSQDGVDFIRNSLDQITQKRGRYLSIRFIV